MKILVVDDDKEIVQLLEIYVRNEGYEPVSAYNGKDALTKLNTTPDIGLVILDLMMPEMDGMEVIKRIRKDSSIPILVLSAKTADMDNKTHMMFHDEDIREEGRQEGRQEGIQIGEESGIKKGKTQAIQQMITITRQLGIPENQLQQKIKQQFHLSDDEIKALFE